ncbi:unnamed protein product [Caenorhabditis brenneri]
MDSEASKTGVRVELANKTIWQKFYPNTEMITKKKGGRIIFPHLEYKIKGLQADSRYKIYLFVERADNEKYKFDCGQWQSIKKGKGTKPPPIQFKEHPLGARLGSHWMNIMVSFSHLRLTTDPNNVDKRMVLAQGMHRYLPVVMIQKVGDESVYPEQFRLRLTEFYAVSAYQSQAMVDLKVAHNKYASWVGKEVKTEVSGAIPTNTPVEPAPSRHSTYSVSNSSTPASVTPPAGELEPPSPVLFNQSGYPNNSMPNQFYDYYGMMHWNPYYWNHYPQNYGAPIGWNAGANMNQFNTQNFF